MADQVDAGTLLPAATVFTASGAIGPGCRRPDVERLVRRGHWHRLRRDVLCHEDVWQRADERERHLLLCAGVLGTSSKTLVLSHLSAAWLWQLPMPSARPEVVAVTDASVRSRTARRRSGVVVHGTPLHGDEYVESGWLRLTTVARTVADCLRHVGLAEGVAMADAALRSGAVTGPDLSGAFERQTGWPGARRLARARSLVDGRRESWLESRSAVVMAEVGIPSPEWQVTVLDHRGRFVAGPTRSGPGSGCSGRPTASASTPPTPSRARTAGGRRCDARSSGRTGSGTWGSRSSAGSRPTSTALRT